MDYKGRATPSLRHVARSGRGALNRYRAMAPFLEKGARVLDAGAGSGEVVYVLRSLGYDAAGLEPDQQYAKHAREVLRVPVDTGFVQDVDYPPGRFDVITMYHALEHVEDPAGILSRLRTWMADRSVLLVEVPNVEARSIAPSHRFHFAHFYNFNRATLEAMGRKTGFDPVETTLSADGGNVTTVFRRARTAAAPIADDENYRRVARAVKEQTAMSYYCSAAPYAGPPGRLRAFLADARAARGCRTPRQVLDRLIARALAEDLRRGKEPPSA
jgi:SAM-dependent methyltransferase